MSGSKRKSEGKANGGEQVNNNAKDGPVTETLEAGTVADTRRAPVVDVAQLYRPSQWYAPLPADAVRGLSKIPGVQQAEVELAVHQVVAQTDMLQQRFAEVASHTSALPALLDRYKTASAALEIAEQSSVYFRDITLVAANDIAQILGIVDDGVRPAAARNAALGTAFSAVFAISDQRGAAIRDGRQRAKAGDASGGGDSTNDGGDTSGGGNNGGGTNGGGMASSGASGDGTGGSPPTGTTH